MPNRDTAEHAANMRRYREQHPEVAEYQKRYMADYLADPINKEKARQRARAYYQANKHRIRKAVLDKYHSKKVLKGYASGPRAANWKGDDVGYHGLHKWVALHLGKPTRCEHCGLEDPAHPKRFQWANKSHEYKRDLEDWLRLCGKCHFAYDQQHRERGEAGRLL